MTTFKVCKRTKSGWSRLTTFNAEDNRERAYNLRLESVRLHYALIELRRTKSNASFWDVCKVGEEVYQGCYGTLSEIWDTRWTPREWWAMEQARLDAQYRAEDNERTRINHAIDFPYRADTPDRVRY